jgi:ribosomal protein L11 methylase PrmA
MKNQLLLLVFLLFFCTKTFAQIKFETGYYIDNFDRKVTCLIKNVDWQNNPKEIEYMINQGDLVQKMPINTIKEFGINGAAKYVRAKVKIDRSSSETDWLTAQKNFTYVEEQLFLKVLIDGEATLYQYIDHNLRRFFFKTRTSEITQLDHKLYLIDGNISQNNYYKQQLFLNLKCETLNETNFKNVDYDNSDLEKIFLKYNKCADPYYSNDIANESTQKRDPFTFTARLGIKSSSLVIENSLANYYNNDFGAKLGFRLGIEGEYVLPFNKNKWSLTIEPTYQNYTLEKIREATYVSGGILVSNVNYQSIELPLTLRHYFFLNDKSKIFANLSAVIDFALNSTIKNSRNDGSLINSLDIDSYPGLAFGAGYKYLNKYSVELRLQPKRNMLGGYLSWDSNYQTVSLIFGYKLF